MRSVGDAEKMTKTADIQLNGGWYFFNGYGPDEDGCDGWMIWSAFPHKRSNSIKLHITIQWCWEYIEY